VKKYALAFMLAAVMAVLGLQPALAADKVVYYAYPMDYTKIYHIASFDWYNGAADYLTLVNQQGGINGYKLEMLTADHANEPQRGIELYEQYKAKGALFFNFFNTPCVAALIPRVLKDKVILLTPQHGRSDASDGTVFPYVFIPTPSYWTQAAAQIEFIMKQEGGSLKGKKIGYNFIDTSWGREPLPIFKKLAAKLGFELMEFPYPPPGTEQTAAWTQIRRSKPDWVILWGIRHVSLTQALRIGYPLSNILTDGWMAEHEVARVGNDKLKGLMSAQVVVTGRDVPIVEKIYNEVQKKGLGKGKDEKVGNIYYNQGVLSGVVFAQAVKVALEKYGEPLTGDKLKDAMETFTNWDPMGLAPPITFTKESHEGAKGLRIAKWDGAKWVPLTGWYETQFHPLVWDFIKEEAAKFKAEKK